MHRNLLKNLLQQYQASPEEQDYKKRMLLFLDESSDCFERSLTSGHFTASAWLESKDGSQVLLMHHTKLNMWVQFGGHCDGNSDVLAVAIKEAQEESGVKSIEPVSSEIFDIDIHRIPANSKEPEHDHYDIRFLLKVTSDESFVKNNESKALAWFGKDKSKLPTDSRSVIRMFEKWCA